MPTATILCPFCTATLSLQDAASLGRPVQCPQCRQSFVAVAPPVTSMLAAGRPLPPSPPPTTPVRPRVRARSSGNGGRVVLLGVGLLVLAIGAAAGVYVILSNVQRPDERAQAKTPTNPEQNTPTTDRDKLSPPDGTLPPAGGSGNPLSQPGTPPQVDVPTDTNKGKPTTEPAGKPIEPVPAEPKKVETPPLTPPTKDPVPPVKNPVTDLDPPLPPLEKNPKTLPKKPDESHSTLSKENQKKVNDAIDKGVQYLKSTQKADGSWEGPMDEITIGYTALAALTLLECGVPANDPGLQKAVAFVRQRAPGVNAGHDTYVLATSIFLLERLGDKTDADLIRYLAARLIAGQQMDGGWSYRCPVLGNQEAQELLTYLQAIKPVPCFLTPQGGASPVPPAAKEPGGKEPAPAGPVEPIFKPYNVNLLSFGVRKLAVVQSTPALKASGRKSKLPMSMSDNSNTQFAVMALWLARKHNVPVEKTMALMDQRFLSTQIANGTWSYAPTFLTASMPMACAGLIGLGVGHGAHKESLGHAWKLAGGKSAKEDGAIQLALSALGNSIGAAPGDWSQPTAQPNLYLVWSIERVAMLYNLKTIGGKDWYGWAAYTLVVNQMPDGKWISGQYTGECPLANTCLALLVLKRANLVPDLTEHLQEYIPIRDPGNQ